MLKERAGRWEFWVDLFAIHLVSTLQVCLGMPPAYIAVTRPVPGIAWLTWFAFVVGIAAVTQEFVADAQLHRFVAHRGCCNPGSSDVASIGGIRD